MMSIMLACGPYFDEGGAIGSLILFFAVKPIAYFAFIEAFRYRVSRAIPMRTSQAVGLTAARVGLSILFVGAWWLFVTIIGSRMHPLGSDGELLVLSWIALYFERIASWWLVGAKGAGLKGRRLLGWVTSGTLIGAAFDFAMVGGLFHGLGVQALIVALIGVFIVVLTIIGRRDSLRRRFTSLPVCITCQYDLTGNLSGRCPECGTPIHGGLRPA